MDFSLNELQTMLADSISRFIDTEYDFDTRQSYAGSERGFSDEVWAKFADLGWTAVPFAEEDGGIGGGPADVMVLMENLARGLVVEPYLANVVLAGGTGEVGRALAPRLKDHSVTILARNAFLAAAPSRSSSARAGR